MSDVRYLTQEGYDALKFELEDLKGRGRTEIAAAIQTAREMGDLSENAEYDAAKDAQGLLELKISKLSNLLATARIADTSDMVEGKVYIFCKVKIKNLKNDMTVSYTLVDEREANLKEFKISVKSPVGKALLGQIKGDVVDIEVPTGVMQFEILDVEIAL